MHKVELLAPARTAEIGIDAFNYGADAVYIGAPAFSARAAAGNSIQDIERLAKYGHQFGAKTIVALNTILRDAELDDAQRLTWNLYEAGVDALIIQDLGLLQLDLPPIELHASTQTDNRSIEKTRLLHDMGMTRVVMARELSIDQIRQIHEAVPDVELECFVHGALCVSISGQCYMSSALTGRSANRGECAQPCRLPMDLYAVKDTNVAANLASSLATDRNALIADKNITLVAKDKHLLSLRDMNRSQHLEALIEAGVTSLKIEGRLKDASYVRNVVAYYRRLIDQLLEKHSDWQSVSQGHCSYDFEPNLSKSFNRGFTAFFAEGKREPMWNFASPKSVGEYVGKVGKIYRDCFDLEGGKLNNGDGIYTGGIGFRLNRFDPSNNHCYPMNGIEICRQLQRGDDLYRNLDTQFEKRLEHAKVKRQIPVDFTFSSSPSQLILTINTNPQDRIEVSLDGEFTSADQPQEQMIQATLQKLGNTIYSCRSVNFLNEQHYFVPVSLVADLRRKAVSAFTDRRIELYNAQRKSYKKPDYRKLICQLDARGILPESYLANVFNECARKTYSDAMIENVDEAFEAMNEKQGLVMQTKHCLKYAFGQCPRFKNPSPERLLVPDAKLGNQAVLKIGNRKFILKFGCKNDCISEIFTIFAPKL